MVGVARPVPYAWQSPPDDEDPERYDVGASFTWDDMIARYAKDLRRRKRKEKHCYDTEKSLLRSSVWFVEHGYAPVNVTCSITREYLGCYKATGVADISVSHKRTKLRALFHWAFMEKFFKRDKLARLEDPGVDDTPPAVIVTRSDIDQIVDQIIRDWSDDSDVASRFAAPGARKFFRLRDIACVLGIAETGARVGEWFGIDVDDYDRETRTFRLRKTKNGDDRMLPVTKAYADGPLAEWMEFRAKIACGTNRLFITEQRGPVDPSTWGKRFDKYRRDAGIAKRIRRHDLRHFSSTAHDRIDKDVSMVIHGHHTDEAHKVYSHRELDEIHAVHDAANPVGDTLTRLAEDKAAREQVAEKAAKRTGKTRAYTGIE